MTKPIAVCCSDVHLTDKPPIMWDKDAWMPCQEYMLQQIHQISVEYNVPVICAGDVFDKPKRSPKIEMLAMNYMQKWNLIAGQHDMPYHNPDLLCEASYGVLMTHNTPWLPEMDIYEFPWGVEFIPLDEQEKKREHELSCAVVHAMIWRNEPPYPGAPTAGNIKNLRNLLAGYDFIVAGDNHGGFVDIGSPVIVNCGSTMRRSVGQIGYNPSVYVLFDDKSVNTIALDISKDVVSSKHKEKAAEKHDRIDAFVSTIKDDIEINLSFEQNMLRAMEANNIEQPVKEIIMEAMS